MKRKTMMLLVLLIAGCSVPAAVPAQVDHGTFVSHINYAEGLYKVNDLTNGVVCYYIVSDTAYNRGPHGVSCVDVGVNRQ